MKVESKGGSDFLVIEVENDSKNLNPFRINIGEIRYMRQYLDDAGKPDGIAIFVGSKMFHTKTDVSSLGIEYINGTNVKVGEAEFYCVKGGGLTDKQAYFYLINTRKILYIRNFIPNGNKSNENNKFAVITVDERIIQIEKF